MRGPGSAVARSPWGASPPPGLEAGQDDLVEHHRPPLPPVLPGQIGVPVPPGRALPLRQLLVRLRVGARQRRDSRRRPYGAGLVRQLLSSAVAEGIELLDIAELQRRLRLHAGAQAGFERAVLLRVEGTEGQRVALTAMAADGEDAGAAAGNRDHRVEAEFDRGAGALLRHAATGPAEKTKGLSPT